MKSAVLLRNKNLTMLAQHSSGVLFSIFRRIFLFYSIDCHSRICMCFWERVVDFPILRLFQKFSLLFVFLHFTHAKHFSPNFSSKVFFFPSLFGRRVNQGKQQKTMYSIRRRRWWWWWRAAASNREEQKERTRRNMLIITFSTSFTIFLGEIFPIFFQQSVSMCVSVYNVDRWMDRWLVGWMDGCLWNAWVECLGLTVLFLLLLSPQQHICMLYM